MSPCEYGTILSMWCSDDNKIYSWYTQDVVIERTNLTFTAWEAPSGLIDNRCFVYTCDCNQIDDCVKPS